MGDRSGDEGPEGGEDVQGAGVAHGGPGGVGEAGDGDRPGCGREGSGQVGEDRDVVRAHLGGAEQDGVARPVHGVAPGLVADDVQSLPDRRLARLADQLGRGDRGGGVVGDGEEQKLRPPALGPDPADGLQEGVRVGDAAAFGRGRHVVRGAAEQPGLRHPGGRAGARHEDVTAVRADQGQQQRLGTGGGGDPRGRAVQPAPVPVAAMCIRDRDGGQLGEDREPGVGGERPVAHGTVVLVRAGPGLPGAGSRRVPGGRVLVGADALAAAHDGPVLAAVLPGGPVFVRPGPAAVLPGGPVLMGADALAAAHPALLRRSSPSLIAAARPSWHGGRPAPVPGCRGPPPRPGVRSPAPVTRHPGFSAPSRGPLEFFIRRFRAARPSSRTAPPGPAHRPRPTGPCGGGWPGSQRASWFSGARPGIR